LKSRIFPQRKKLEPPLQIINKLQASEPRTNEELKRIQSKLKLRKLLDLGWEIPWFREREERGGWLKGREEIDLV
jgi:hypothetical protein